MNGQETKRTAPLPYVIGIVGALLIVWVLVSAMRRYTNPAPIGANRAAERAKFLAELRAMESDFLTRYAWQDQAKGFVRLPIAQAMEITVREYQNPAVARAELLKKVDLATAPPPPPPPSEFE